MVPDEPSPHTVAFCPRCLCPIDIRQTYQVKFCLPVRPTFQQAAPTGPVPASQDPTQSPPAYPSRSSTLQQCDAPTPPQPDNAPAPPPEPSGHSQPQERKRDRATHGENRRSSSSSTSSFESTFTQFSYNDEFLAEFKAIEDHHFSKTPFKPSSSQLLPPSSQPTPPSSQPPPSSPSTESSLTLTDALASSPSMESSLAPSTLDKPLPTARHWVVFRGRVPGIYASSTEATSQTDGFPHAFMLAFDDPAAADAVYKEFQVSGTIPTHGRGPWVVFIGRRPGVFTSYEELCNSVVGFSNNCYRCCENVEEGKQALKMFMERQVATVFPAPTTQSTPGPSHFGHLSDPATTVDDSWWCCFAGAEPGVYQGIARLIQAAPAVGGIHRVSSEGEGWELFTTYLTNDEVRVVPRA